MTLQKKQMPRKSVASAAPKPESTLPASAPVKTKKKTGRPSSYSVEIADAICERIALGESLLKICSEDDKPSQSMVYRWLEQNQEFREKYARARDMQADVYAADIIRLADECREGVKTKETKDGTFKEFGDMVERSRLQIDARKWYASKLAPKKYGDKLELEVDDKRENSADRLAELLARAASRTVKEPDAKRAE